MPCLARKKMQNINTNFSQQLSAWWWRDDNLGPESPAVTESLTNSLKPNKNCRNLNELKQCCKEEWAKFPPQPYETLAIMQKITFIWLTCFYKLLNHAGNLVLNTQLIVFCFIFV